MPNTASPYRSSSLLKGLEKLFFASRIVLWSQTAVMHNPLRFGRSCKYTFLALCTLLVMPTTLASLYARQSDKQLTLLSAYRLQGLTTLVTVLPFTLLSLAFAYLLWNPTILSAGLDLQQAEAHQALANRQALSLVFIFILLIIDLLFAMLYMVIRTDHVQHNRTFTSWQVLWQTTCIMFCHIVNISLFCMWLTMVGCILFSLPQLLANYVIIYGNLYLQLPYDVLFNIPKWVYKLPSVLIFGGSLGLTIHTFAHGLWHCWQRNLAEYRQL